MTRSCHLAAIAVLPCLAAAVLPALRVSAAPAPQVALALPTAPPENAIVLFSGKNTEIPAKFYQRYTKDPGAWRLGADGAATPDGHDIATRNEWGDCMVHVEFRCPADAQGHPIGEGKSGVGLQGRYEIQILNSYNQAPEEHGCGAIYDEKPPRVAASRPAGQWQTYDIIFRAPRFDDAGKVTERPRVTVLQNGILVQNNEEIPHPTGIQYGELKGEVKTGPLILQGDHDRVQFRNVWLAPL